MSRSGRCRCGALLHFQITPRGYKRRCPACQAIVRLRAAPAAPAGAGAPHPHPGPGRPAAPPDLLALPRHEPDAPVALTDIPAYNGPQARPPAATRGLWLVATILAVVVAVGAVTALLSL